MPRTVTDHDHRYASAKISSDSEEEENPGPASVTSFYVGRCGFRNCKFETTSSESFSKVSGVGIVLLIVLNKILFILGCRLSYEPLEERGSPWSSKSGSRD